MRTRRAILVSVGGLITLTGCSQQSSQPAEESDAEGASGEFGINQFRVGGENPDEYEAEFISGSSPESVADELTPEVSYLISGASDEVETEVRYEYSDATIPEGEPLDETVEGDTHEGSGEYRQTPSMPDELVSEIVENPKNLVVTFRATDMESEVTKTEEYESNFADSYIEQIQEESFSVDRLETSSAEPVKIEAKERVLTIEYNSGYEIGERGFEQEMAGIAGLFGSNVRRTRIPYELEIKVNGIDGETYEKNVSSDMPNRTLNGEIREDMLGTKVYFDELKPE